MLCCCVGVFCTSDAFHCKIRNDSSDQVCMFVMVCDKVVCVKMVCEKWFVTKLRVTKLCVCDKVVCV